MQGAVVTPFTNFFLDLLANSNQTNKISVQPTNQPTKPPNITNQSKNNVANTFKILNFF